MFTLREVTEEFIGAEEITFLWYHVLRSRLFSFLAGDTQPFLVKANRTATELWHIVVPVVDDYTDIALLWVTRGATGPVWWLFLFVLVLADVERLWFLGTLCITGCFTAVLLPYLCLGYLFGTRYLLHSTASTMHPPGCGLGVWWIHFFGPCSGQERDARHVQPAWAERECSEGGD